MTVKGGAEVNNGGVANVELKIGDNVIADVTEVPFEYTYTFPEDQQTGELTIDRRAHDLTYRDRGQGSSGI